MIRSDCQVHLPDHYLSVLGGGEGLCSGPSYKLNIYGERNDLRGGKYIEKDHIIMRLILLCGIAGLYMRYDILSVEYRN